MAIRKHDTGLEFGPTYLITEEDYIRFLEINNDAKLLAVKMKERHGVEMASATISESYYLSIKDQLNDRAADTAQAQPGGDCSSQGAGG